MINSLATIRRAYRYIAAYERRILDTVDVVDESLRGLGFERKAPHRWQPIYNSFPSRAYAPDHWVWDNIPNYAMRYFWVAGDPNTAGSRFVLVDHIADTAFEDHRLTKPREPKPLDDLGEPESSLSIMRWHIISFAEALAKDEYSLSWNNLLASQMGLKIRELLVAAPTPKPLTHRSAAISHTIHCVDISFLNDASSLRDQFLTPLLQALSEN